MKKRIMSLFLAVVMVLGLFPTAAVAYSGSQSNGYTVTGAADLADLLRTLDPDQHYPIFYMIEAESTFTVDLDLTIPGNVTLYLNDNELVVEAGCTFTVERSAQGMGEVAARGLTVNGGGKVVNKGAIHLSSHADIYGEMTNDEKGWLSVEGALSIIGGKMTNGGTIELPYDRLRSFANDIVCMHGGIFTMTNTGLITWLCYVAQEGYLRSALEQLKGQLAEHPDWNQTADILINDAITLTEDLTVPEDARLCVQGYFNSNGTRAGGMLTIPADVTLTTEGMSILDGPVVIEGSWVSGNTIWIQTNYDSGGPYYGSASLALEEGGSYQGICIQVDRPHSIPTGQEWSWNLQLPGFTAAMFDSIEEEEWAVFLREGSGGSGEGPHTHSWDEGKVTQAPTCKDPGVMTYTCTVSGCGQTKTESIPKTDQHTPDGNTECAKATLCTVCGETLKEAGEHSWDEGEVTTPATATSTGVMTYTCTKCKTTKTEIIPKLESTAEGGFGLAAPLLFWRLDAAGTLTVFGRGAIPDYKTASGAPWYEHRSQIKKIVLEDGVTGIGDYAFSGCSNAVSIAAPDSLDMPGTLESVGDYAFLNCSSLKELRFLKSTTDLAFITMDRGCSSLRAIRFSDSENPLYCSVSGVVYSKDKSQLVRLPPAYSGAFTVRNTAASIAAGAFAQCDSLTTLTIPESVTELGISVFQAGPGAAYPAKLTQVTFQGDAPEISSLTFTKDQEKEAFKVYYYDDAEGWDKVLNMDCADYISFVSKQRLINLHSSTYLNGKTTSGSTMKGSQRFKNSVSKLDKELFVNSLTAVSLAKADSATADVIRGQIYNLLYKSTFRPTQFQQNNSNANIKKWQIQNTAYSHNALPYSKQTPAGDISTKKITNDAGLKALGTPKVEWSNGAAGCYSYTRFASTYIYGNNGIDRTERTDPSAATLKAWFNKWLDPGETIRYKAGAKREHALVFLGESMDGEGFYYISYGGGDFPALTASDKYKYVDAGNGKLRPAVDFTEDTMDIGYFSYVDFAKATSYVQLWDANASTDKSNKTDSGAVKSGSYAVGTAKTVSINKNNNCGQIGSKTSKAVLAAKCPVEMVVTVDGYVLDSRTIADGATMSYGDTASLYAESDGEGGRNITLTLTAEELQELDIDVEIIGTADGFMDLTATLTLVEEDEDDGIPDETSTDVRTFLNVPITADGVVEVCGLSALGVTEVVLSAEDSGSSDGDEDEDVHVRETIWVAGENETVTAPDPEYRLYPELGEDAFGDDEEVSGGSSGGGSSGGSSVSSYAVSVESSENGAVSVDPENAREGSTVTVTVKPETGYMLETLTVTDRNGSAIGTVEKNGKYTFTMPASKVTVKAVFTKDHTIRNSFADVPADAYYYEPVLWAVKNGITSGTSATMFSPDRICTRAQAVTFLWRAAGSPVVNDVMNFTDVPADAYYAEAVRWAVSQGITSGTSATTFSPDRICTRAQIVTFLWRTTGNPNVVATNPFDDVRMDQYYADAVLWAVAEGVTAGTSSTAFSPDDGCTRAQIVTFIWRQTVD